MLRGRERQGREGRDGTKKGEMKDHSPYHKLVDLPRSTDENPDPLRKRGKTMASRNMHAKLRNQKYRSNLSKYIFIVAHQTRAEEWLK